VDERFIPLAAFVRGTRAASGAVPEPVSLTTAPAPAVAEVADGFVHAETVRDLTLMRLAAFEAFESAKHALLVSLAEAVLGRELALAPADVDALAKRVIELFHDLEPVSLVVSAADAERVRTPLPTRVDLSLAAGDLVVEVRDGALESRFAFRLRAALARALPGAA
jgi:flagellar biosynthesis/type III secretory pathway protein FliH